MAPRIKDRIRSAYRPGIGYDALMVAVFPVSSYPRAWRYATKGGPPGCSMAFSRALREMSASISYDGDRRVWGITLASPCPPV